MSELYNCELKEMFLSQYTHDATQYNYRKTLEIVGGKEKSLFKDIKDFKEYEILDVLESFNTKSRSALDSRVTVLRQYLDYCRGKGLITENLLKNFSSDDYEKNKEKLNNKSRSSTIIFSRDELYQDYCGKMINAQDAVIFALLFEGLRGMKSSELTNLKIEDINIKENKIIVRNPENNEIIRELIVDKRCMEIIEKAIKQEVYYKKIFNDENMKAPGERNLNITSYLIRSVSLNAKDADLPVGYQVITNRVKNMAVELGKPYLTVMTLAQCGIMVDFKELEEQKGTLTTEDYKKIYKKHGGNEENYFDIKELYINNFK